MANPDRMQGAGEIHAALSTSSPEYMQGAAIPHICNYPAHLQLSRTFAAIPHTSSCPARRGHLPRALASIPQPRIYPAHSQLTCTLAAIPHTLVYPAQPPLLSPAGFAMQRNRYNLSSDDSGLDEVHLALTCGGHASERIFDLIRRQVDDDTIWEAHEPVSLAKIIAAAKVAGLAMAYFDIGHKVPLECVQVRCPPPCVYPARSHLARIPRSPFIFPPPFHLSRPPEPIPLFFIYPVAAIYPAPWHLSRSVASIPPTRIYPAP